MRKENFDFYSIGPKCKTDNSNERVQQCQTPRLGPTFTPRHQQTSSHGGLRKTPRTIIHSINKTPAELSETLTDTLPHLARFRLPPIRIDQDK